MALIKVKPTSPGRRGVLKVVTPDLHKGKPHAPLLESQSKHAGRNTDGRITVRDRKSTRLNSSHPQHSFPTRRSSDLVGKRNDWKKAYVSLKPGQEINFAAGE